MHGSRDGSAAVEESRRLAKRLAELGRPVELLVIAGAGHVFNFRDRRQAGLAWKATLAFLDRYLRRKERSFLHSAKVDQPAHNPRCKALDCKRKIYISYSVGAMCGRPA